MKKIFFINTLAFMLIALSSCNKLLDIKPVNSMMPVTIKDYESVLIGGYPKRDFYYRTELMTDNAMVNLVTTYTLTRAEEPWFVWASSMLLDGIQQDEYWGVMYKSIFYANTVLDNLNSRTPDAQDRQLYEKIKGEAYALRAFNYFYLVNLYADTYTSAHLQLPGVPMPLTAEDINANKNNNVRETIEKVWGQIAADIEQASSLLVAKPDAGKFRFNYTSVQLLKARVMLFMGNYQAAIDAASEAIGGSTLADLNSLQAHIDAKGNSYAFTGTTGFIDTDYKNEILFYMGGKANNNLFYFGTGAGKPTEELLNLTKRYGDLTDYRQYIFDSFAIPNTSEGAQTGATMYNMFAKQENPSYFIGLKASEAYVIRAEAYVRSNRGNLAINDLNSLLKTRIKKNKYVPLTSADFADNDALLKRVLEERRLETALDAGLRWLDLRRLGKPQITHNYKNGIVYTLKKDDPRYLLQIPPSEYNNSPDMPINPR